MRSANSCRAQSSVARTSTVSIRSLAAVGLACLGLASATAFAQGSPEGPMTAPPPALLPVAGTGFGGMGGFPGDQPFFGAPFLVNPSSPVPANGGLLIGTGDSFSVPQITVSNTSTPGVTIGGTTTLLGGQLWVWVPSAPAAPGTYSVNMSVPDGGGGFFTSSATVTVTEAWTPALPQIDTAPSASWIGQLSSSACCQTWIQGFGLDFGNCFATQQVGTIELSPGLTSPVPLAHVNQFLYRVRPAGSAADLFAFAGWGAQSVLSFSVQAEEYCFEIDVMNITTQEVTTLADLAGNCAPHGELDELGTTTIEPDASSLGHLACNAPPDGYEETWCDLNEGACAEAPNAQGCQVYGHTCRGEPLPVVHGSFGGMFVAGSGAVGGAGVGVVGGASGASGIGGSGARSGDGGRSGSGDKDPPMDEEEEEPAEDGDSDGCSVSAARASDASHAGAAWLLVMAAAALRLRKRSRS